MSGHPVLRVLVALVVVAAVGLALPDAAHAWTPGTHIFLAESVLNNLHLLPQSVAELLRAFPYDFLYGNIAADTSIGKHHAPVGRHCHAWHVGQEIHDLADTPALRAFGLGYLSHLSADTIAHNYFVPRQLMVTSSSSGMGHSYWETRVETLLGDTFARSARTLIEQDHEPAHRHLDRIISPTLFSLQTNRRLFRGMVRLTDNPGWQLAYRVVHETSRWSLTSWLVERHLSHAFEAMVETLAEASSVPRRLDPSGQQPLRSSKLIRRALFREQGREGRQWLGAFADEHFGLPERPLRFWTHADILRPWETSNLLPS